MDTKDRAAEALRDEFHDLRKRAEPPSASAGVGGKMAEVVRFLMGEAPLEGRWFDEPDPHVGGAYWWRKHLTEALAQQPAATSETVNVIGMPEFDGLLDHIYEHGTAAEGVIEKANAFARAVIARYAPQQPAAVDEAMVFRLAVWMAKHDGCEDPHRLIYEGSPPVPWGEVWNRYEYDARAALTAALAAQHQEPT